MAQTGVERRLISILAADVAGYSKLMADDEEGTLSSLKHIHTDILDTLIPEYRGRVVKLMGDGALMAFDSVVDAVKFAIEFQQKIGQYNQGFPESRTIRFRIGINIGDVVIDGDDIYGDGVNIAARLEGFAEPGGICVARTVVEQVRGKLEARFIDCGERKARNIPGAIHVYTVDNGTGIPSWDVADGRDQVKPGDPAENKVTGIDYSIPDTPSIAVLPFTNMSRDPDQEYFSDGITEDIITALSKIDDLLVVSRNSTFIYKDRHVDIKQISEEQGVRYVLEGSVRKSGTRARITAQLIDATSGHHVWAEKYDRDLEDIFAVQDEITREVVIAMDSKLGIGLQAVAWSSGTRNLEAWEKIRRSMAILNDVYADNIHESVRLCTRALELDPGYPMAWVVMGWIHHHRTEVKLGVRTQEEKNEALEKAEECVNKALELDPDCADAWAMLGMCRLTERKFDEAVQYSEKAVSLAPGHAELLGIAAVVMNKCGYPDRGKSLIRRAMRSSPSHPGWFLQSLAISYRLTGELDKSIEALQLASLRSPDYLGIHVNLASTLGEAGRSEESKESVTEILRLDPEFHISRYMDKISYSDEKELERIEQGLRQAGLPD